MRSPLSTSDPSLAVFPDSYRQACRLWEAHVAGCALPALVDTYPHPGQSPEGTPLVTHVAWLGTPAARRVLVMIGGTHGIEGFAGTAVMCDLLAGLPRQLHDDLAILCIHALNPWGYAWHRRCDAEGIDLNRNFIDFGQALPDNPGYRALRAALFDDDSARRQRVLDEYRRVHGQTAYEIAVSGGQYGDPLGPFYGGVQPAQGRRTIEAILHFCDTRSDVMRFFRTTWIPDETFFQTLVQQLVAQEEIRSRTLTFLMFTDYGMPLTFYNDHYDLLLSQDYLFARKISPDAKELKRRLGALYAVEGARFPISNEG